MYPKGGGDDKLVIFKKREEINGDDFTDSGSIYYDYMDSKVRKFIKLK